MSTSTNCFPCCHTKTSPAPEVYAAPASPITKAPTRIFLPGDSIAPAPAATRETNFSRRAPQAPKTIYFNAPSTEQTLVNIAELVKLLQEHAGAVKPTVPLASLQQLGLEIVHAFDKDPQGRYSYELAELAKSGDKILTRAVLNSLTKAIQAKTLFDADLMQAIALTLQYANADAFTPEDFIVILQFLEDKTASTELLVQLQAIGAVLDSMVASNVRGISRTHVHKKLDAFLETSSKDKDPQTAALAKYARQALTRVPTDESKLASYLRRALHLGEGVSLVMQAWGQKSITTAIDAFKEFRKAFKPAPNQEEWYDTLQFFKILIQGENFEQISLFLQQHPKALNKELAILLSQELSLFLLSNPDDQEAYQLLRAHLKSFCDPQDIKLPPVTQPSDALFSEARTSLAWRIQELKLERLKLPEDYKLYIPGEGALDPNSDTRFDLADSVYKFLAQDITQVLLLQGSSGSGKSMFLRLLETRLWENVQEKKNLPLYIRLGGIDPNTTTLLEDELSRQGFDTDQILELKRSMPVVVLLDGYDEIKGGVLVNLIEKKTHGWNAKVVISSRAQHLATVSHYRSLFVPYKGDRPDLSKLEEIFVLPFSPLNIKAYLETYTRETKAKWNAEKYLEEINSFRGLSSLIETPFILSIVARVLPKLVESRKPSDSLEMTRRTLYNAFADDWFQRQGNKLITASQEASTEIENLSEECSEFCQELATKMVRQGVVEVEYAPLDIFDMSSQKNSEWDSFFGEDETTVFIRSCCPLTKTAGGWAFIHKSLLEHFASKQATEELFKIQDVEMSKLAKRKSLFKNKKEKTAFVNPLQIKTTHDLAQALQGKLSEKEALLLKELAFAMIKESHSENVMELAALGSFQDFTFIHALLESLIDPINKNMLASLKLFQALSYVLKHVDVETVQPNDLTQILAIVSQKIQILSKIQDEETLYIELKAVATILEILGDANCLKLSEDNTNSLYETLSSVQTQHPQLQGLISYTKQALLRVPSDKNKLAIFFKRGQLMIKGLSSVTEAVGTYSPRKLLDGLLSFKEAFASKGNKQSWFEELRILKVLLNKQDVPDTLSAIRESVSKLSPPATLFALELLDRAICQTSSDAIQLCLLEMLTSLKIRIEVPDYIDALFLRYKSFDAPEVRKYIQPLPLGFTALRFYTELLISSEQSTLVNSARGSLAGRLFELYVDTVYDPLAQEEATLLVPVKGAWDIRDKESFHLEEQVRLFLEEDKKVLLLLGASGSGKSLFTRQLAATLAKENADVIPLFIPLTGIPHDSTTIIEDALTSKGFTNSQIQTLKQTKTFFFFLDARDEMQGTLSTNLFCSNNLDKWQCKVIFTCRTQDLEKISSYKHLFYPPKGDGFDYDNFVEMTIVPFSDSQIESYLTQYIIYTNSSWTVDVYKHHIDALPGLRQMIENPFVLRIMTEVLPDIIEMYSAKETQEKLSLTRVDLYDAFVRKWFSRQIDKLIRAGKLQNLEGVEQRFYQFSQKLAAKMSVEGLTEVVYTPPSRHNKEVSEWEVFFGSKGPLVVQAKKAAPLLIIRNEKTISFRFLHKSLLEFLASRDSFGTFTVSKENLLALMPQRSSLENSTLNQRLFGNDQGTLTFWVDDVNQKESFKNQLLDIVEQSKTNINLATSSANALTILVAANHSFSGCDLKGIQASGAILDGGNFWGTNLDDANLENVSLSGAELSEATLRNANLQGATLAEGLILKGHTSAVSSIAWDSKGERLASGSQDNTLRLWEASTGKVLCVFGGHADIVTSVAWDSKGERLASGSKDNTLHLWDVSTGRALHVFKGHTESVTSVAWDSRGKRLASGSEDNTLRLWEAPTGKAPRIFRSYDETLRLWEASKGKALRVFEGHTSYVYSVAWDSKGERLASGSEDNTLRLWDVFTGKALRVFEGHTSGVNSVAWDSKGERLASGSRDKTIRLWEVSTGKALRVFDGHTSFVISVAWDSKGERLASGGRDNTLRLWEASTGKALRVFEGHTENVISVAWDPKGERLASGSEDNTIRLWEASTSKALRVFDGHMEDVNSVAWDPQGERLASGSEDNTIRLWEASTGKALCVFEGHAESVTSVAWDGQGKRLASGSHDNTLRLWDVSTGKSLRVFEGQMESVTSIAWGRQGIRLASGNNDETLRLYQASTGKVLRIFDGHTGIVNSVAWDSKGKRLASGSEDNTIRLWEAFTGKALRVFKGHTSAVYSVAWDPKGERVASGSEDNTIRLWGASTGKALRVFKGHTSAVYSIAWDPKGERLASGSEDNTVRLWETSTGKVLRVFKGHRNRVCSVAWDPKGEKLASGSKDKTLRLWEIHKDQDEIKVGLTWKQDEVLRCNDLDISGAQIEERTKAILLQRGAHETESQKALA